MNKFLLVTFLSFSISASASEANDSLSNEEEQNKSLIEQLFTELPFECNTFPNCDGEVSEEEKMAREAEEKQSSYSPSTENNSNPE